MGDKKEGKKAHSKPDAGKEEDIKKNPSVTKLPDPFTCYISACPEPRNTDFNNPEFLVCYKCPSVSNAEGQTKYFCYPIIASSSMFPMDKYMKKSSSNTSIEDCDTRNEHTEPPPNFNNTHQWYPHVNQGCHFFPSAAVFRQFPQHIPQQQPFFPRPPPYAYQSFDGNFYFHNGPNNSV